MRLTVNHNTKYSYSEPTRRLIQLLRVTPSSFPGQSVLDWRIDVDVDAKLREGRDGYGNIIHMLYVDRPLQALSVTVTGRALTEDRAGVVQNLPGELPHQVFTRSTPLTEPGPALTDLAAEIEAVKGTTLDRLHRLNALLHARLRFDTDATGIDTSAEQALAAGHGVCQDFAHIFSAAARRAGIAARYVSGHLFRRDGAHLQEAAHAWAEGWVEELGWVAFDPTNGVCADDSYIRVASGLDYRDAAPVAGARAGGGDEELAVQVEVREARQQQSQAQN